MFQARLKLICSIRLSDMDIYFIWSISSWYLIYLSLQMSYILRIKTGQ